jgi:phosphohistidine phosphatase
LNPLKTLYLIRHGKSSRSNFDMADKERALTDRGIKNCQEVGSILNEEEPSPTFLASSAARRTIQSSENILLRHPILPEFQQAYDELYIPDLETLQRFITKLSDEHEAVIIVGHEPSISEMLMSITKKPIEAIVTASISKIQFNCDEWSQALVDTVSSVHHRNRHDWLGKRLL